MWRLVLVAAVGCAEHGSSDPDPNDCSGLGCASMPGTLTLTVVDSATQLPVKGTLTFSATGQALPFTCSAAVGPGAACPSWLLSQQGGFDVDVAATGYMVGHIHVDIQGPPQCCGTGPDSSASLALTPG